MAVWYVVVLPSMPEEHGSILHALEWKNLLISDQYLRVMKSVPMCPPRTRDLGKFLRSLVGHVGIVLGIEEPRGGWTRRKETREERGNENHGWAFRYSG
jgi:hypothetical protein